MSIFKVDVLAGQHIVISGGVGAIGLGLVKGLVAHGASVTVNDIIPVGEAEKRLSEAGVDPAVVPYIQADMTQKEEASAFVAAARRQQGPIHTAICNAAVAITAQLLDFAADDWDKTMDVNVKAAFLLAQAAAQSMIQDEVAGHLIFTTSWVADFAWPSVAPYNISKSALNHLMRCYARQLVGQGIRANALAPGVVGVGMAQNQWDTEPEFRDLCDRAIPLGHLQTLESVVDAFIYLCSPAAAYMTGSVFTIDGGCSLYPLA
ncbi:SDR family NAD(P)-dependent oxidoreductase [Chloroflexota bacterium]